MSVALALLSFAESLETKRIERKELKQERKEKRAIKKLKKKACIERFHLRQQLREEEERREEDKKFLEEKAARLFSPRQPSEPPPLHLLPIHRFVRGAQARLDALVGR
jgi:hypothetical protein